MPKSPKRGRRTSSRPASSQMAAATGRAIQVVRTDRGWSRRDFAERTQLSYSFLSEIENGVKEPSSRTFALIADALDVAPPHCCMTRSAAWPKTSRARRPSCCERQERREWALIWGGQQGDAREHRKIWKSSRATSRRSGRRATLPALPRRPDRAAKRRPASNGRVACSTGWPGPSPVAAAAIRDRLERAARIVATGR